MSEFRIETPTYQHRTTGGWVVTCTVPVDWPPALHVGDEHRVDPRGAAGVLGGHDRGKRTLVALQR